MQWIGVFCALSCVAAAPEAPLGISIGDTVLVDFEVEIKRTSKQEIIAKLDRIDSKNGITILPWLVELTVEPIETRAKAKMTRLRGKYRMRVAANAPLGSRRVLATIQFFERDRKSVWAKHAISHEVEVKPSAADESSIRADKKEYASHSASSKTLYEQLSSLKGRLHPTRIDPPLDERGLDENTRRLLSEFYEAKLKADVAKQRLRAAAESADEKTAELAVIALATLAKKPEGEEKKARAIEGKSVSQSLNLARQHLEQLRFSEAEGILDKLKQIGRATAPELANLLLLSGAVSAAKDDAQNARKLYGQALCLNPELEAPSPRNPMKRAFEDVKNEGKCSYPIRAGLISAQKRDGETGDEIVISIAFDKDPYELIAGGDIELFGSGGGVFFERKLRAVHKGDHAILEAVLPEDEEFQTIEGRLLVRAIARDVSGVALAWIGAPDPIATPIGSSSESSGSFLPWWGWVAGGIAIAGAVATTLVITQTPESSRGIGPISVSF